MSELTAPEKVTVDSYRRIADIWTEDHSTERFWGENFDYFKELLPSGRILEVGCGAGRDAQELIKIGYDYHGIDITAKLIESARKLNPDGNFEEANLYDFHSDEPFDGFWCAAVLIHLPKDRIDEALQAIKRNLKSRAIGFIAMKAGVGEMVEVRPELDDAEFLFTYYENDEFKGVLSRNGLEVLKQDYMPFSERTNWLTYHVRSE